MKDKLDKDIEKIKVTRMSDDEKFIFKLFKSLKKITMFIGNDIYFYIPKENFIFKYNPDTKVLWYNHEYIYMELRNTDGIIDGEITKYILKYVNEYLKLNIDKLQIWHFIDIKIFKSINNHIIKNSINNYIIKNG